MMAFPLGRYLGDEGWKVRLVDNQYGCMYTMCSNIS